MTENSDEDVMPTAQLIAALSAASNLTPRELILLDRLKTALEEVDDVERQLQVQLRKHNLDDEDTP